MKLTPEIIKQIEDDLSKVKTYEDQIGKNGAIKKLLKSTSGSILEAIIQLSSNKLSRSD